MTFIQAHHIGAVLTITITAALGVFSLIRGWGQGTTRLFGFYSLFIAGWCLFYDQMYITTDESWALFSGRFLHCFSYFIPATFLHFVQHLTNSVQNKTQTQIRIGYYLVAFTVILFAFHPQFVTSVQPKYGFPFYIVWGPLYYVFFFWFALAICYVFFILLKSYRTSTGRKRVQLSYVLVAYAIGYTGGCMVFLPHFKCPVPTWSLYLVVFAHIFIIYAIIKHELLNLKILVRRAALLTLIYASLLASATPLFFHLHNTLTNNSPSFFFIEVIMMSAVLSFGPFIYAYFIRRGAYFHEHTIAGLTHELKSPLGVIESATASLLDDMENPTIDKNKISEYLKMIQNNTNRLQTFAQNLIHAAKDQDDEVVIDKKPCDVSEIIRTACDHWRAQAERKNITLGYEGPKEAVIQGDPVKLHQIISNVLSNAVKFSERGKITVKLQKGPEQCLCEVRDGGKGIAPEHLKKVFNRFFQAHPGSKGTGIGLTIAKTWVEAHGGKIWAESEGEGKGTTMRFTLPL